MHSSMQKPIKSRRRVNVGTTLSTPKDPNLEIRGTKWIQHTQLDDKRSKNHQNDLEEQRQNFQQLSEYNPWGKPGGGAPTDSSRKLKFLETQMSSAAISLPNMESAIDTFFTFGRPGNGAPQVTTSGRLRTQLIGDPQIRFQETQNVHKSIENGIRYFGRKDALQEYHNELDSIVRQKEAVKQRELQTEKLMEFEHRNRYPFGRNSVENSLRIMPVTDPIFTSTSARSSVSLEDRIQKRKEMMNDSCEAGTYDPWGKGFGTPIRDKFGNVSRRSPRRSLLETYDEPQTDESVTINMGKYSGGDGSPHQNESSLIITKLPRTLNKDGVKEPESFSDGLSTQRNDRERKTFMERLGWAEDSETAEKTKKGKQLYLQNLSYLINQQVAMEENQKSKKEEEVENKKECMELVQLMREKRVGQPRRDSSTGLLLDNKLPSTDITKRLEPNIMKLPDSGVTKYQTALSKQAEERHQAIMKLKQQEQLESLKHFEVMDSYWSKPGNGAANHPDNHRLEGFSYMYTSRSPKLMIKSRNRLINHRQRLKPAT